MNLLFLFIATVTADRYADYNKFPNRRVDNEPSYDRRNEYPSRYNYDHTDPHRQFEGMNERHGRSYCNNRTAQVDIEMEEIMGMWYGVEFIPHLTGDPGTYRTESCIIIHIAETTVEPSTSASVYHHRAVFQTSWYRQYRHLRLLWDEDGSDVEYSLYFRNDSVGFWNSEGDQNGTLPGFRSYQQFAGTVQVLKAVGDHLLLHFCQEPGVSGRSPQLFSVLLSREPRKLQRWEIESAHALLRRKNLSVTTRRLVCGNTGYKVMASLWMLLALAAHWGRV